MFHLFTCDIQFQALNFAFWAAQADQSAGKFAWNASSLVQKWLTFGRESSGCVDMRGIYVKTRPRKKKNIDTNKTAVQFKALSLKLRNLASFLCFIFFIYRVNYIIFFYWCTEDNWRRACGCTEDHHRLTGNQPLEYLWAFAFTNFNSKQTERERERKRERVIWKIFLGIVEFNRPHCYFSLM